MKELLTDIVDKMSNNIVENTVLNSGSVMSQEQLMSQENGSSGKSVSSYGEGNHDELMDQYNRLLDVFNNETNEANNKNMIDITQNQDMQSEEIVSQADDQTFKGNETEMIEDDQMNNHPIALKTTQKVIQNHKVQIKNGKSKIL